MTPPSESLFAAAKHQQSGYEGCSSPPIVAPSTPSFTPPPSPPVSLYEFSKSPSPSAVPCAASRDRRPSETITICSEDVVPVPPPYSLARLREAVYSNRGLFIIVVSQFFGSLMSLSTRLLETGPQKIHALQILFVRQSITSMGCLSWMWYNAVPDAPLGPRGSVRWLLVLRGLGGFWGVFGLYYSLTYLDLSDATVITFLSPITTSFVCSVVPALKEPFTKHEMFAGIMSLLGVMFIARPASLFPERGEDDHYGDVQAEIAARSSAVPPPKAAPQQRAIAVLMGLVGVLGATLAFTTIRWIGKRAHPLISVNYFATWSTIVSAIALAAVPQVGGIVWPATLWQWLLLGGIGITGFVMQFMLTYGLQLVKAGRGAMMIYTQMLFALLWERLVWGTTPELMSIMGGALILGSTIWVGTRKLRTEPTTMSASGGGGGGGGGIDDAEAGLLDERQMPRDSDDSA